MSAMNFSRRQVFQLVCTGAIASLAPSIFRGNASAARGWCRADPLLRIAGQQVHVYISSPTAMLQSATDKIRLTVMLPVGVEGRKLDVLADFGKGYDIRFLTSAGLMVVGGRVPVVVSVYCPALDASLPVEVVISPVGSGPLASASATGSANSLVPL